jgi:hypothetical protein
MADPVPTRSAFFLARMPGSGIDSSAGGERGEAAGEIRPAGTRTRLSPSPPPARWMARGPRR